MHAERSLKITIVSTLALVVLQGGLTCLLLEKLQFGAGGPHLRQLALLLIAAACTVSGWFLAWHFMARRDDPPAEAGPHASLLLQSVEEGVVSVDGTGCVTFANQAAQELLGYQEGELVGRDLREVMHHGKDPDCAHCGKESCLLHPAFTGGRRQRSRNEVLWRKNGSSFSADFSCSALAGGSRPGAVLTFRNVSARREVEDRLRLQGAALEAAMNGIIIADRQERIIWVNQALCRILGASPEELLGKKPQLLFTAGDKPELLENLSESLEARRPWQGELLGCCEDGTTLDQEVTVTPVLDEAGELSNFVWIMLDISQRKQSEAALQESTRLQEEANRQLVRTVQRANELAVKSARASAAKSDFLANMSHEIRTPMNAIVGAGHLLLDTELSPRQGEYLQTLMVSADLLLGIINDVLDFSKIEAGKLMIERVAFRLQDVVAELLAVYALRARQQGIDLDVELDPQIPELLTGDPMRLAQILNNLLSNALKFTRHGSVQLAVKLARREPGTAELIFAVRDSGIGILAEDQALLFQAFTQLDGSITRSHGGTGLGLAICRRLTSMMKGEIWCESIPGLGSTFSFWLPFGIAAADSRVERKKKAGFTRFRQQQVLLVEDNPFNQKVALALLERGGLQVTVASNGAEAVELVRRRDFDLVLMDIRMPGKDGLTAAREIRALGKPGTETLPILAVSANAMEHDVAASLAAGMNGHVAKPFTPESLYSAISVWLDGQGSARASGQGAVAGGHEQAQERQPVAKIDFETGVRQTGGDRKLYRDLLKQFEREYQNQGGEIEREIRGGNREEAARLAHSVKGIAGVLAAQPLHGAAQRLETALKGEGDLGKELSDFQEELKGTIGCLQADGWQNLTSSVPRQQAEAAGAGASRVQA
ncbi:PAS domain S-box protein [Geomonas nitrogeniifigens]|uniref:PAS domain-containing hybrid sensor histidine kinase/response regulator n=1 Tax=Geomonas diazotrophica TaxID=2843197 RepID=UPI001C2C89F2|nr:PAS domain S-box protein [Geomonas nitrogeniifigens]QXE85421.1 PAS domain S-box protein [Geomonas nitrogeniifigens]